MSVRSYPQAWSRRDANGRAGRAEAMTRVPRRGVGRPVARRPSPLRAAHARRRAGRPLVEHDPEQARGLPEGVRRLRRRRRSRGSGRRTSSGCSPTRDRAQPAQGRVHDRERAARARGAGRARELRRVPLGLRRRRADRRRLADARRAARGDELSKALSKDLKKRGFRFVGPTVCYAFMQSVGLVNDHTVDCFRFAELDVNAPIQYARSGDVNIAYQVTGDGPFDLVFVAGFFSHLEIDWELPAHAHFFDRLGSFARLIRFDKRGTGLSDRGVGLPDFETRMDDVRAVMDAAGSESAALFGYSEGGPMCVLFAATYPERSARSCCTARTRNARPRRRLPVGADLGGARARRPGARGGVGRERRALRRWGRTRTPPWRRWLHRRGRAGPSPAGARDFILMNSKADVREVLPSVQCPTLVAPPHGRPRRHVEEGRYIAEPHSRRALRRARGRRPRAPFIDPDQILDEIEEFLTGVRPAPATNRVLATCSSPTSSGRPNAPRSATPRGQLAARHTTTVRRELSGSPARRSTPRATASSPSSTGLRGRFAARSRFARTLRTLGLDVRAGVHTGEVERRPGREAARASPCTSAPGSCRSRAPARFSSARRRETSSPAPVSSSRTAASTS